MMVMQHDEDVVLCKLGYNDSDEVEEEDAAIGTLVDSQFVEH